MMHKKLRVPEMSIEAISAIFRGALSVRKRSPHFIYEIGPSSEVLSKALDNGFYRLEQVEAALLLCQDVEGGERLTE